MRLRPHTHAAPLELAKLDFEKKAPQHRAAAAIQPASLPPEHFSQFAARSSDPKRFPVKWSYHSLAGGYYYPE
jgi:hypothetical protein